MKIVRFKAAGKTRYGALEGQHILEYSGTPYSTFKKGRRRWPVKQVVLLTPAVPSKIVCVGLNYRDHAEEMALPIPEEDLVARTSAVMMLLPGDLISTGTPAGVGPLVPGDRVEVRIEGIGSLKNPVIKL